jgi:hypothetical protein
VTNVFRGQTAISAGVGASGRVVGGLLSVGDRVHIVPGDESAVIRGKYCCLAWCIREADEHIVRSTGAGRRDGAVGRRRLGHHGLPVGHRDEHRQVSGPRTGAALFG